MRREFYICDFCRAEQDYTCPASGPVLLWKRVIVRNLFDKDCAPRNIDACPKCVAAKGLA